MQISRRGLFGLSLAPIAVTAIKAEPVAKGRGYFTVSWYNGPRGIGCMKDANGNEALLDDETHFAGGIDIPRTGQRVFVEWELQRKGRYAKYVWQA